jgi:hypothetical protein
MLTDQWDGDKNFLFYIKYQDFDKLLVNLDRILDKILPWTRLGRQTFNAESKRFSIRPMWQVQNFVQKKKLNTTYISKTFAQNIIISRKHRGGMKFPKNHETRR